MFKTGDTVELKYPKNWTNSKLRKEAVKKEGRIKGFMLHYEFFKYPAYTPNNLKKFKSVSLGFKRCDFPYFFGEMLVLTSRMVLTEKIDVKLQAAIYKTFN